MFDFPTASEQTPIWEHWVKQFGLSRPKSMPDCPYWTGSEIHDCCEDAWRFGITLQKAAGGIVPAALKKRGAIEEMRRNAHNAYSSASYDGLFQYAPMEIPGVTDLASGREISTDAFPVAATGRMDG